MSFDTKESDRNMTTAKICILVTIVAYLCLMIFVGIHFGKKNAGGPPTSSIWAAGSWAPSSPP